MALSGGLHITSANQSVLSVVDGGADLLPGEPESFDAGVVALVLCTVPDQSSALAELFRVIRPGGELRFYEHVIAGFQFQTCERFPFSPTFLFPLTRTSWGWPGVRNHGLWSSHVRATLRASS